MSISVCLFVCLSVCLFVKFKVIELKKHAYARQSHIQRLPYPAFAAFLLVEMSFSWMGGMMRNYTRLLQIFHDLWRAVVWLASMLDNAEV